MFFSLIWIYSLDLMSNTQIKRGCIKMWSSVLGTMETVGVNVTLRNVQVTWKHPFMYGINRYQVKRVIYCPPLVLMIDIKLKV